ncbi:hypothetical protein ABT336_13745 [Micromonospora sp. NPDC000207]|uniref:hypothetical protein n=1 Tax=Micromonospora sp. NPDC000207 TaxID=3154246 RepID=UPI00331A9376
MRAAAVDGALAGAVGSVALNVVSYLDMVVRARPESSTPQASAGRLAEVAGIDLGPQETAANRRSGLGPVLGYGLGIAAGAVFALFVGDRRPPRPVEVAILGGGVMTLSDGSMTALGVTRPRSWTRSDWLADLVPHLAYGLAASASWRRLRRR